MGKFAPKAPSAHHETRTSRNALLALACGAALAFIFIAGLGVGRSSVPPTDVEGILAARFLGIGSLDSWPASASSIVLNIRLPRVIAALLIGSALAISGASYQGLFRNPMVSPDILGASAGASFGAAIALLLS